MEITTIQRYIHTSPRKLRLVADLVRKTKPEQSLKILQFINKAAAKPLAQAIKTVLANAKQQKLSPEDLKFKKLEIDEGPTLGRYHAGTKGRIKPYKKRFSHIKIVLTDELEDRKPTEGETRQRRQETSDKLKKDLKKETKLEEGDK